MPPIEDQPRDWTEPGAYLVAPGVYRVPLPLPLDGLTAVNAYVLEGADGLTVIDPGWVGAKSEQAMTDALSKLGYSLDDISTCLATHHHGDHYSQAYTWRAKLGSTLFAGREERHSISSIITDTGEFPNHGPLLTRCGAIDLAKRVASGDVSAAWADVDFGEPDGWLDHGDEIALRDGSLQVVATPGHTRGHIVFHHRATATLFSGDHILPSITPSIGFEWSPEPYPLRSYLSSLELVRCLPDAALLPSHGPVTASTHTRVDELLSHHERRLDDVCERIADGASTAYEVAQSMPWTRRSHRLDDLPLEHQLCAVTEIGAHLDVLTMQGRLRQRDSAATRHYALAS
ncbi:MBL fold metallo-hydrolase [Skermania sp. ID1734]|uniref:MBL fold metallo-hydrolase n=1 Tax=Skermania sp. ID1734 TaxID=2597516 RepID=UPI001180EE2B|nr:MBL fold metallo-hydrolase [Skermania sp. ID1734]TSD92957.1 MBL fold metallo-hydrolase [Skermania sp. ID1734]